MGYRTLLADLEAQPARVLVLELSVLCTQTLQLGFHFQFAHRVSPNLSVVSIASLHTGRGKPEGSLVLAKSASIRSTSCRRSLAVLVHCSIRSLSDENSGDISTHLFSFSRAARSAD
jgi:hypothetical protein